MAFLEFEARKEGEEERGGLGKKRFLLDPTHENGDGDTDNKGLTERQREEGRKPEIGKICQSDLFDRLSAFLPQIRQSNQQLEEEKGAGAKDLAVEILSISESASSESESESDEADNDTLCTEPEENNGRQPHTERKAATSVEMTLRVGILEDTKNKDQIDALRLPVIPSDLIE